MKILLTSATLFEIEPTVNWLRARAETEAGNVLQFGGVSVEVLFTGVGLTATAYALGARLAAGEHPTLAIQAGVGGAIDPKLNLGQVVRITSEQFGDLGAEDKDGQHLSLGQIGLHPGHPFNQAIGKQSEWISGQHRPHEGPVSHSSGRKHGGRSIFLRLPPEWHRATTTARHQ